MSPQKDTEPSAKRGAATRSRSGGGFTAEERAAMKERSRELRAARGRGKDADGESDVLAKIAGMQEADRAVATRVHQIVRATAPDLTARTWYGMPAYAKDGTVICFFQDGGKFKTRYATLGFSDKARLDEGPMWATSYALTELTPAVEKTIADLVRRAVS